MGAPSNRKETERFHAACPDSLQDKLAGWLQESGIVKDPKSQKWQGVLTQGLFRAIILSEIPGEFVGLLYEQELARRRDARLGSDQIRERLRQIVIAEHKGKRVAPHSGGSFRGQ